MADNVTLNSGAGGATAAADDIGGVHYQRVKLAVGADGAASDAIPVSAGLDTTAAGVQAAGLVAQLDDASTAAVTENQFAPVRLSSRRALLVEGVASGTAIAVSESGSATSAKQDTIIGHLDGVEGLLTTIDGDTGTLAGAVSGSEMQVDVVGALPAGANAIGKLAANSGVDIGDVDVTSIAAGTNVIGDVGLAPRTSGGLTIHRSIDLDESEEEVKATAGQLYGVWFTNTSTGTRWLKFYNDTAANVIVGTTTPVITIGLPGNTSDDISGVLFNGGLGIPFSAAICAAATTGVADADTGAPGANEVIVNIFFK
jgi:hypothetical protein